MEPNPEQIKEWTRTIAAKVLQNLPRGKCVPMQSNQMWAAEVLGIKSYQSLFDLREDARKGRLPERSVFLNMEQMTSQTLEKILRGESTGTILVVEV